MVLVLFISEHYGTMWGFYYDGFIYECDALRECSFPTILSCPFPYSTAPLIFPNTSFFYFQVFTLKI